MTRLLVSVRSAEEARIALRAGAHLIDVKEPARGALGAADPATMRDVVECVDGRVPISVALGDLGSHSRLLPELAGAVQFAKIGLAGCLQNGRDWPLSWRAALNALPAGVRRVAVAYADWPVARAPEPWTILEQAVAAGCGATLLDTFDKTSAPLGHHLSLADVARFVEQSHHSSLICVLAGRLDLAAVKMYASLAPDYIGVRGAACSGGRSGRLEAPRVRELVAALRRRVAQRI